MKLAAVNPRLDANIEGLLSKDVCKISLKLSLDTFFGSICNRLIYYLLLAYDGSPSTCGGLVLHLLSGSRLK